MHFFHITRIISFSSIVFVNFLIKILNILHLYLKMTALIDISMTNTKSPHNFTKNSLDKTMESRHYNFTQHFENIQQQKKSFQLIIKKPQWSYDLLVIVELQNTSTSTRIMLLDRKGDILKINEQQSKTYLIRKYLSTDTTYHPRIDPLSGAIYFRLDYFLSLKEKIQHSQNIKHKILSNLNFDKLHRSIQMLQSFYQHGLEHYWNDGNFGMGKYYKEMSKNVAKLGNGDGGVKEEEGDVKEVNVKSMHTLKSLVRDLSQFVSMQKCDETSLNQRMFQKQLKQLQAQGVHLSALTKRKQGKANYESLLINAKSQRTLDQTISNMLENNINRSAMKVIQSDLGKITLNLQKQDATLFKSKTRLLMNLPRNTEYHFIDKYFKYNSNMPVQISLSLKEQSLPRFLEVNKVSMSVETGMRVMLQVCTAVNTMWEEKNVILSVNSPQKIFVTKNLTIKIRSLSQYFQVEPHMMLEDKSSVNFKLIDNFLSLSEIYFKVFFGHSINYVRPSLITYSESKFAESSRTLKIVKNLVGSKLVQKRLHNPIQQILVGLNYIFLSIVDKAQKLIIEPMSKMSRQQVFRVQGKEEVIDEDDKKDVKLLNLRLTCCWLFKNLELIAKQGI